MELERLLERIEEIREIVTERNMEVMEIEEKVQGQLAPRINAIRDGSALDSVDAAVQGKLSLNR